MKPTRPRILALAALAAFVLLVVASAASVAHARPGGGHSFSGGSHSSGGSHYSSGGSHYSGRRGGGGSGGGGDIGLLFQLLFQYPQIGIPELLFVVLLVMAKRREALQRASSSTWDSGNFHSYQPRAAAAAPERRLAALRDDDPDFSAVLFDDFTFSLYARAHRARHDAAQLAQLTPSLEGDARAQLARLAAAAGGAPVTAVVVGSSTIVRVGRRDGFDSVRVRFEANLVGARGTEYVREEWVLRRLVGARTKPWKGARTFNCPTCAAPATRFADNNCEYCGEVVDAGRFDWAVNAIERTASEPRPPSLTGTVEEVGTDDPTVFDVAAQSEWARLLADDPAVTPERFGARLALVYMALNRGWNASDARLVRPWVSDGLYAYLEYWLDAYRAQKLQNRLDHATLTSWTIARVTRDRHYDAVTVRLWATGNDYTVSLPDGRVVGGSKSRGRAYSEYWTLVRAAGVRGAPRADLACPNCGAQLTAGMGGACEHCGAVVTRGDFDWVLSKIEQDESYAG
jgi:predicted lipid-binding transport protein (Tim44 family)